MKCMRGSNTCPPHILRKTIFMYEHIVSEIVKRKRRRTRRSCANDTKFVTCAMSDVAHTPGGGSGNRTAVCVWVATARAGSGTALKGIAEVTLRYFAVISETNLTIGLWVIVVNARTVGQLPVPAVQAAFG